VAVNCASLPETLIESELFGYRAGAFTGAQRTGRRGKILQADGGTLFLDEIADMPLELQARLLRVLDERQVTPLGTEETHPVDFQLISASHQHLPALVREVPRRPLLPPRRHRAALPPLRGAATRELILAVLAAEAGGAAPSAEAERLRCSSIRGRATSASCATCCAPPPRWPTASRSRASTCPRCPCGPRRAAAQVAPAVRLAVSMADDAGGATCRSNSTRSRPTSARFCSNCSNSIAGT
jgi:hypothetical protein